MKSPEQELRESIARAASWHPSAPDPEKYVVLWRGKLFHASNPGDLVEDVMDHLRELEREEAA